MVDIMSITVPLIPMIGVIIVLGIVAFVCGVLLIYLGVPTVFTQWLANMMKQDLLFTATPTEMWVERGSKKYKTDIMYKRGGILGKKGPLNHMDPTKWDAGNKVRWGSTNVLFYFPGKAWPKTIPRMAAVQSCLKVAKTKIPRAENYKQPGLVDKLLMKNVPEPQKDENAIIQYNEYLSLIAEKNPAKAATLLTCTEDELPSMVARFVVLPVEVKPEDKAKITEITTQLLEEVKMVRLYCKDLITPPSFVALPEMMAAYPDAETSDEMIEKIDAERTREAKAGSGIDLKWIVLGGLGLSLIFVVVIALILFMK
jgi:hypothetical protein